MDKNEDAKMLIPYNKAKGQYDKLFPTLFDLGNISKDDERIVNAILSELHRLPYSESGIEIDYDRIAILAGGQYTRELKIDGERVIATNNIKRFSTAIEDIGSFLSQVHYKKVIGLDEFGIPNKFDHIFLFKDKFTIDHGARKLTVYLSDYIYQDEVLDETGAIETPQRRVYELFYQDDWSKIHHLKYSLFIHNSLKSQYSMRLYREIAGYRSYGSYYAYAERFEKDIMKLSTPSLIQNKSVLIRRAFKELKELKDQFGNPIIPDLEMVIERRGRGTYKYSFTFKKFTNDLLPVLGMTSEGFYILQFPSQQMSVIDSQEEDADYIEVSNYFVTIFGTDNSVNNSNNRNTLKEWLKVADKELIIEMLRRTSTDSSRKFGWTIKAMKNLLSQDVTTIEGLRESDQLKFNRSESLITRLIEQNPQYAQLFVMLKELTSEPTIAPVIIEDVENY
ncbi:replication initiation protein, partial [Streptococcus phocae]